MVATTTYIAVLLLSLLSFVTTCIGVTLAIQFRRSKRGIACGIGFSAGIMMLISILELIPESIAKAGNLLTLTSVAAGVVLIWVLNIIIPHTHLVDESRKVERTALRSAYLIVFGLILHDVPEGFAMANSYVASHSLGILVALAIALHNIPEEFAMAIPVVPLRRPRFLYGSALLSALAEPAGAIVGLLAVDVFPKLNPLFMAFAAGAMMFISLHELLPMARRYGHLGLFGVGAVCSLIVHQLLSMAIN